MKKIQKIGIFALPSAALLAISIIGCPSDNPPPEAQEETLKEWEYQGQAYQDQTVTVDFSANLGAPDYKATGFLYGLGRDGTKPPDPLLSDLKPKLFRGGAVYYAGEENGWGWAQTNANDEMRKIGYQTRFNSIKAQYDRVTQYGPDGYYQVLLSDLWFSGTVREDTKLSPYPGDSGDWTLWESFLRRVAADKRENNMANIRYDIWNEPDGEYFWPRGDERYFQMWKKAVEVLRDADPDAVIVGPGYSGFNSSRLSTWLDKTKADNALPDILDWHFSRDPVTDVEIAKGLLAQKSITSIKKISIGEYLLDNESGHEQHSGYSAWYIGRLQRTDIIGAIHAVWRSLDDGSLNDILTSGLSRRGRWWVYKSYADITGALLRITASTNIDGVAGINEQEKTARILLGNNFYRNNETGQGETVKQIGVSLTGLDNAAYLCPSGKVRVEVYRIEETRFASTGPVLKKKFFVRVADGAATFTIPWDNWNDACTIKITPYNK